MANPTTYFGWVMPTSSSLVTNLPADFNTFGQGVDTSLQDLLGGTTGQVLSKTSSTNMDFTWVTPTDQTPLTTKGDLFTFTTVDARLAVGNNGETLVADSSASSGLRYQSGYNGNAIINGGLDIWQRGTSFSNVNGTYTADRWLCSRQGTTGLTVSRQTSGLTGILYSLRGQRDSGNTSTQDIYLQNSLESMDSYRFAGQTVTVSFYAKVGANFSGSSSNAFALLYSGTGTDQNLYSGYTGSATVASNTSITMTTSWQRFSITGTVASTATELGVRLGWTPTGTAGANDWIEITGVQLELGSVATSFKRAGGTIQGELAACQRYYQRISGGNDIVGSGQWTGSTTALIVVPNKVTMRTAPAVSGTVTNLNVTNVTGGAIVATAVSGVVTGVTNQLISITTASGGNTGGGTTSFTNGANGILEMSSEL